MTLVTVGKNGRVWRRKFDHDEARALRVADPKRWTYPALAARYGVSINGIQRVLNDRRRAINAEHSLAWAWEHKRAPCKGGCGRLVWLLTAPDRTGYCPTCLGRERTRTVRAATLLCSRCGQWKPDDVFPRKQAAKARRERHDLCRQCQTEARQEYRLRRKVPCATCGTPVLPPSEKGARGAPVARCRDCYDRARSAA